MSNTQDDFKRVDVEATPKANLPNHKIFYEKLSGKEDQNGLSINYEWTSKKLSFEESEKLAQ